MITKEFFKRLLSCFFIGIVFGGSYLHSQLLFSFLFLVIFGIIFIFEWPYLVPVHGVKAFFLSPIYPGLPMLALMALLCGFYMQDFYLPLYPFLVSWSADTAGYAVGKMIGYHKVCPSISPGKSWEGLLGSWIGVFMMNVFVLPRIVTAPFPALAHSWIVLIGVSGMLTGIAFLGGTLVSILKRAKGLKDTGNILPGHGGLLDRFDSVFAVVLVVWALLAVPHVLQKVSVYSEEKDGNVSAVQEFVPESVVSVDKKEV